MRRYAVMTLILMVSSALCAKENKTPPDPEWAAITARGRALAEYVVTAHAARDKVLALQPPAGTITHYVALRSEGKWTVYFGRYAEAQNVFLVTHEAVQGASPEEFEVRRLQPPREDTGECLHAVHAMDAAVSDFKPVQRYQVAVLPAEANQWYVYLFPAQTQPGAYIYGGDARYLISPDGRTIAEKRQLHSSILTSREANIPKGAKVAGGFHTHILSTTPEDTDVLMVLLRESHVQEYVSGGKKTYVIEADGTIRLAK